MATQFLHSDQTLFRDVDVFEIDYVPELFNYRETPMNELAFQISPALRGGRALNAICMGLPGTGKTTSVFRIFAELEQFRGKVLPVYVNCQTDRTKYMIYSRIYAKLFGHAPARTGLSIRSVMDAIGDALQKRKVGLIVCLDDANLLHYDGTLGDILNSLLRLHQDYPGVRTSVFTTISDVDLDLVRNLDPWVVSVFRPTMIYFPPYDAEEIRGILRERVRAGLYPNVLSPDMFEIIIEQTMESGDVRVGLDLVKRAVMHAEAASRTEVVKGDIMAAYEQAKHVHLVCTVRALSAGERLLLRRIAELSQEQTEPLVSKDIYAAVKGTASIGYTAFFKRLRKLNSLRLVDMIRVRSSDRTNEIVLRYEPEKVREVCG